MYLCDEVSTGDGCVFAMTALEYELETLSLENATSYNV